MRRRKQIMGILLSWAFLLGIFQFMPIDINGEMVFAAAVQSSDNSLSSLSISPGSLSPAFQYNVVNYTASVDADVTSVDVSAQLSNDTAVIESVSGNTDLQPGENLVSIVVKAQDGTPATYKIVVTRKEGQPGAGAAEQPDEAGTATAEQQPQGAETDHPGGITIDGHPFNLSPTIAAELVPQDFTKETVSCQGQQVEGLSFEKSELTLVYLTTPSTEVKNTLAVYEEASGSFYPFRMISFGESNYLIILNPPAETDLPAQYTQEAKTVGEYQNVPTYVKEAAQEAAEDTAPGSDKAGFSLVYGISSYGNKGWYQYDALESTFQRYVPAEEAAQPVIPEDGGQEDVIEPGAEMQSLQKAYTDMEEQYNKQKDSSRKTIAVLTFIIAVLLVVVVNLLLRGRKGVEELEDDFDYDELTEKVREQVKSARRTRREESGLGTGIIEDDSGDFWEDRTVPKAILKQQTKTIPEIDPKQQMESGQRPVRKQRLEGRQEAKADRKLQRKQEAKADRKPEGKQEAKADKKLERRQETKADKKLERRQETKTARRPEPVIERHTEPDARLDEDFEVIDLEDL